MTFHDDFIVYLTVGLGEAEVSADLLVSPHFEQWRTRHHALPRAVFVQKCRPSWRDGTAPAGLIYTGCMTVMDLLVA